jgi:hypothetical protein
MAVDVNNEPTRSPGNPTESWQLFKDEKALTMPAQGLFDRRDFLQKTLTHQGISWFQGIRE